MNETNEFSRAAILANQTFRRLHREGHPEADAKLLVVGVINAEEVAMEKHTQPFDEARLVQRLHQLPDTSADA